MLFKYYEELQSLRTVVQMIEHNDEFKYYEELQSLRTLSRSSPHIRRSNITKNYNP